MNPDELSAGYDKLQQAAGTINVAREMMDRLVALGDNVSFEDIMDAASRLVAQGLDPTNMAGMLAEASQTGGENGKLLAEWVKQKDADLQQREAQLEQVTSQMRHQMVLTGMGMLKGAQGAGQAPAATPNALMPPQDADVSPASPTLAPETPNG